MSYEDEDNTYVSAANRLQLLALGSEHEWVYDTRGDCFTGWHASPECKRCGVMPVSSTCYHELPYPPGATEEWLSARGIVVDPDARVQCEP